MVYRVLAAGGRRQRGATPGAPVALGQIRRAARQEALLRLALLGPARQRGSYL